MDFDDVEGILAEFKVEKSQESEEEKNERKPVKTEEPASEKPGDIDETPE